MNNFSKDLTKAKNTYPAIDNMMKVYERGLITFDECLKEIAEIYHQETRKEAIATYLKEAT